MSDKVFVPLDKEAFFWFRDNGETYELRGCPGKFNEKTVVKGKNVEIRWGYKNKKDVLLGKVGNILIGDLNYIFDKVDFKKIIPIANSREDAIEKAKKILNKKKDFSQFIAFEIIFL